MSTHAEDLKLRLMTIELLRTAKYRRNITYRELGAKTGLPVTVLSRYAKGHVLPNTARSKQLLRVLSKLVGLDVELKSRIKFDDNGYFDNTEIIGDYNILQQAANYALSNFAGKRVTKVLTVAVDGVPLGSMVANVLGVNLIIAKPDKNAGVKGFLEETYILGRDSGLAITLYVPKDAIKKRDSVLIVDDMIKSGETQEALISLTKKAKAEVSGIFALFTIGEEWKKRLKNTSDSPVEVVTHIKAPAGSSL
ncbi:MAG: adenine phosphoribosyltransferase [Nitrososphaerota archaeon]|uniref:phosphoribosyltransferase family protein n=1 Tax=Candidatus Bathycorpusculum sp. TaxID=2994959 RepID=UPI0028386C11|nr:adenine phosphoribosyltransferase [Candidatus Termiticorpusculum sp.]MCL2292426.1 adenine phosphoribosyltransferase [Candidatus Termiticorpusculum sp.]MDR0460994.1 adenine phosphoribosyltransferase [Nitrososphaerota archaeon]